MTLILTLLHLVNIAVEASFSVEEDFPVKGENCMKP